MRLSKPLTSKIRMPKKLRCQQKLPMNPFSENATNGPAPTRCRTSRNSPEFTYFLNNVRKMAKKRSNEAENLYKECCSALDKEKETMISFFKELNSDDDLTFE